MPVVSLGNAGLIALPAAPATIGEPLSAGFASLLVVLAAVLPSNEVTVAAAEPLPAAELELSGI